MFFFSSDLTPLYRQGSICSLQHYCNSHASCQEVSSAHAAIYHTRNESPVLSLSFCRFVSSCGSIYYPVCLCPSILLSALKDPNSVSCLSFPHLRLPVILSLSLFTPPDLGYILFSTCSIHNMMLTLLRIRISNAVLITAIFPKHYSTIQMCL